MYMNNNIDLLNSIDQCVIESDINVTLALIDSYTKAISIMENYDGDDISSFDIFTESCIFQEGELMDYATGKNNIGENKFIKIIAFLPRLIIGFFKMLFGKLNKEAPSTQEVEELTNTIQNMSQEQLNATIDNAEKSGFIKEDDKPEVKKEKKSFLASLKAKRLRIKTNISRIKNASKLIHRIGVEFNPYNDGQIKSFIKEMNAIRSGEKNFDKESRDIALDAVVGLFDDFSAVANSLTDGAKIASEKMDKSIEKMKNDPNIDTSKLEEKSRVFKEFSETSSSFMNAMLEEVNSMIKPLKWANHLLNPGKEFNRAIHPLGGGSKQRKAAAKTSGANDWVSISKFIDADGNNIKSEIKDMTDAKYFKVVNIENDIAELSINGKDSADIFIPVNNLKKLDKVDLSKIPNYYKNTK